jgi:peroxiredoxin Q/BCP
VVLLGVSDDDVPTHQKFRDKYQLNMPLLADVEQAVCKAYGVLKPTGGIARQSFLVDEKGLVAKHWPKVDAGAHPAQVLAELAGN